MNIYSSQCNRNSGGRCKYSDIYPPCVKEQKRGGRVMLVAKKKLPPFFYNNGGRCGMSKGVFQEIKCVMIR